MTTPLQNEISAAIAVHGLPIVSIQTGTLVWRVQETVHANPLFYNPDSSTGYAWTQALSGVVMRHGLEVDGMLYPSQVYPLTGSFKGCNLALFDGRRPQLEAVGKQGLGELELSSGETVGEFLSRLRIAIE